MMRFFKFSTFFFVALFAATLAFAQDAEKEAKLIKDIAADACDCFSDVDWENTPSQEAMGQGETCLQQSMVKFLPQIMAAYGTDEFSEEIGQAMGEKIGMQLVKDCPSFMTFSKLLAEAEEETGEEDSAEDMKELAGKITSSKNDKNHQYLTLKEADGTEHRLLWMLAFDGFADFPKSAKAFEGKSVRVAYREVLIYMPKEGDYKPRKVILGMREE